MKTQKIEQNRVRTMLFGAILLLLVVLGVFYSLERLGLTQILHGNTSTATPSALDLEKKAKVANNSSIPTTSNEDTPDKPSLPDPYQPPSDNSGIGIEAAQHGQLVTISTKLVGYSDGECTLTVSANNTSVTHTAKVMYQSQASMCAGFSVPVSEVGNGTWSIKVVIVSGGKTTEKTISFGVR